MRFTVQGWIRVMVAWAASAALLTACGGGGGGGATPGGTAPFAETAAAYWVSGTGARWVYRRVDGRAGMDATPVLKTVADAGEATVDGVRTRRFEHSWSLFEQAPETEYRHFDGRSILSLADLAGDFGVGLPVETYAEVPAPLVDGQTVTVADRTVSMDLDGDGQADSLRIVAQSTIGRTATLSVPAGAFSDLLRVRTVITGTVVDGATGASASASATLTTWYARGVGVVRRVFEDPEFAAPANVVTEELVGLDAGGLRAGVLPGMTLLDGIGAGTDSSTPAALDVVVGGDRLLALATRADAVEAAVRTLDGGLVWRGTAMRAPTGHEFGALSATFDGTDFRVVATHRRPFDSAAQTTVVSQRVAGDGTLRDGASGRVLQTGIADPTQTVGALRTGARDGRLLVAWGRYDTSYVEWAPGLVQPRGYVLEGRLFDAAGAPLAPAFELADALPAAVQVRDDQFIVVPMPQVSTATALRAWAVSAVDGLPVSGAGTVIDERLLARTGTALHRVGDALWLSFSSFAAGTEGSAAPALTVARLGRDGALLDGTPAAPGRDLLQADAVRGFGMLGLGGPVHVLAWTEGWDGLQATTFTDGVLAGTAPLAATTLALAPGDPAGASSSSRSLLWAGAAGSGVMVVWLDNEQSAATPSDRIMGTLLLPPLSQP